MNRTKTKTLDRILSFALALMMIMAVVPVNAIAAEENSSYGTVTTYTGGTVTNNGTANVEVLVEETTLEWVEANSLRDAGWWIGICVTAPKGFSPDASYKSKNNPAAEYGEAKSFAEKKDGDDYIQLWFPVSPDSLNQFASESRNLTLMYAFDWDANGNYEQEITFSVVPSEKIVLMKNGVQQYPAVVNYGTVSTYTGGTVSNNGTANVEVLVEETTLEWVEANSLRDAGWWVGICATAPKGFSADAKYKSKNNPTAEYGDAKSFAEKKDGDDYIQLWFPVSPGSLNKFSSEGRNLTFMYAFDWDANGNYEQEITFSVVPSEKIVLKQNGTQIYPIPTYTVSVVSEYAGGQVFFDDTVADSVTVDAGAKTKFTAKADSGYQIAAISVGGNTINDAAGQTEYTTEIEVSDNVEITVTFVKVWTVTVTYTENGKVDVTPAGEGGAVTVENGKEVVIKATPNEHYNVGKVTINGDEDKDVTGKNDTTYEKTLKADQEYTVEITFAPNVYTVTVNDSANGTAKVDLPSVEYNGSAKVYLAPNDGYTVDAITVNESPVTNVTRDQTGIWFAVENISANQKVVVSYKETAKADKSNLSIDDTDDLRPDIDTLVVLKEGTKIVFSTEKNGIRVYNNDSLVSGDEATQSVTVYSTMSVTKIELYYQADGELYADWHTVVMDEIKIVVDKGDNVTASLVPDPAANTNGYHNSNVTFAVNTEDTGDYSGLALVEYWITYNGTKGDVKELYKHDAEIKNVFTDSEKVVVDASLYNSDDVKVTLHVVDRAGNEKTIEKELKINSTKPTVSLDITGTKFDNAKEGYYNDKRELTITIVDRKDTFSKVNVATGLTIKRNGEILAVNTDDITWTDSDNLHIGKYVFESDGHYEWNISYTNIAGLSNEGVAAPADKFIYDFYVDKAEPYNLKVTYEPKFTDVVLETITFGFYKAPVKAIIEAVDDTAEIAQFEYKYTGADGVAVSDADIKRDGSRAYAEFIIPAEFRGQVSFSATDKAGRTAELKDERVVVIDTIAPGITVTWSPAEGNNGKYFNVDRTATIEIEEANFFADDIKDGLLVITQTMVLNDGTRFEDTLAPEFVKDGNVYVATVTFAEDADYTFDIKYTDRSGNVYDEYPMDEFTIDKIAPIIEVSYDNNECINESQFNLPRKATIKVTEHNFVEAGIVAKVNGAEYALTWKPVKDVADTYEAEVPFPGDAHYQFEVAGVDLANNANDGVDTGNSVAPWDFTVDRSGPQDLKVTYIPDFIETFLENATFGFYKAPVKVRIEASDDIAGIDYFTYSYTVQNGASSVNAGEKDIKVVATPVDGTNTAYATFEVPAQFRGFVSFTATNKAGVSASTADTNAVVVDDIAPGIQVAYGNYDAQNDKYYKADRTATITIKEANFFAKDIEDGLLVITRKAVANDGTIKEENLAPQFTKIENSDKYVATIDFDQDADYTFDIKYTDRSGNVYDDYDADEFTVDKIAPKISIDKANGAFFNADRTAKITVVEHNFRASDFSIRDAEGNLTITATDCIGTPIDLSSKEYEAYLKNDDNWTPVAADTWETKITFDIEGNYTIGATYTDLAGNEQETPISDTFCVDKSTPENLKISYNPTFVGMLLETITFGFYQAPVTVTIEATDDVAGVDHFAYSYTVEKDASNTNEGKSNVIVQAERDGSTSRWFATFDIPAQFRGNVSFTAFDKATNDDSITDGNVVVVDNVAPGVNVVYDNNDDYNDGYFRADRTATITINEANFFAQDIEDGLLVITVEKTLNDGTYTSTKMSPVFTKNGDIYTAEILFDENADYTFDIKYTDRSGNVYDSYEKDVFTVDKIDPIIDVSYDTEALYENGNQFRTNRTATIKITEHNFRADYVAAKVMASGKEVARYAEDLKNDANWKHYNSAGVEVQNAADGDVHVAIIEYTEEAHYTFEIGCTDKAGRTNDGVVNYGDSVAPTAFTVDKSAPTEMDIKINDSTVAGSMTELVFNRFYDATVAIKLSANCDISGLQSFKYQKVANASDYKVDGVWNDYNAETGIVVNPSEKIIVYFRAEDRAGNVNIIRSTGIVVDNQKPVGETKAPEIDILPAAPNANGIHNGNVNVDLKVVDPKYVGATANANGHYSGLNKITYRIYATDTTAVEEGTLLDLVSKTDGAVFDADRLVSSWSGRITVDSAKFNSNNVIVEVTATDNAGNTRTTTTAAGDIKIDITVPIIDVTYDNNSADNAKYFKDNRVETIVVTERNFNADDVKVTITNTDGVIPTISGWSKTEGTGNLDDTKWTATVTYNVDGDYTFDIAYTDLADNACAGAQYGVSVAPTEFTVDKTLPVVSVSYDNNNAKNDKYFASSRTATVVINEHNFDVNRVVFTQTAALNGTAITIPSATWVNNGDSHTATIAFTADGDYTFDVVVTDMAANESEAANYGNSVAGKEFVIDQNIEKPTIGGIVNGGAYKEKVVPTISFNDVNYDTYEVKLVRTRMGEKNVDVTDKFIKAIDEQAQGGSGSYDTFEKIVENDGIYTLTVKMIDKAGNEDTEEYTFTVNRFGSVYVYSDYLASLIKDGGQYITSIDGDLVITEYNADRILDGSLKILLTRDGEAIDVDFTSNPSDINAQVSIGESGWYQYVYTIKSSNFEKDGVYKISLISSYATTDSKKNDSTSVPENSVDAAGNKVVDAINFTVDATPPEIRNIIGLDQAIVNAQDLTVKYTVVDVGGLKSVEIFVDNKPLDTVTAFDNLNSYTGEFVLGENNNAQTVRIKVTDLAGNVTDTESIDDEDVPLGEFAFNKTVTVSTNLFVRWYANKLLFWGSIGGVVVLAGAICFVVAFKRKKKEEK